MAGAQPRAARAAAPLPAAAAAALVVALLLAAAPRAAAGPRDSKGARITLRAKWPATPLLHEAAEFLVRPRSGGRRRQAWGRFGPTLGPGVTRQAAPRCEAATGSTRAEHMAT